MNSGLPPWGEEYDFAWYGVGLVDLHQDTDVGIGLSDALWSDGWPGTTPDKDFFPISEPATLALVALGGLGTLLRRRPNGGARQATRTAVPPTWPGRATPRRACRS